MEREIKLIAWLSPAFWCYFLGICFGNVVPLDPGWLERVQELTVLLAIPLLLFPSEIKTWLRLAPTTLLSYLGWLIALLGSATVIRYALADWLPYPNEMAAMMSSVHTGGTPNMLAVQTAIGAPGSLFDKMNFVDLSISGVYLVLVLTLMHRLLSWVLPGFKSQTRETAPKQVSPKARQRDWRIYIRPFLLSILVVGLSIGLAYLMTGHLDARWIVVALAALGLLASVFQSVKQLEGSYELGTYIFLIFCVAVGARVKVEALLLEAGPVFAFMASVMGLSLVIHTLLCRLMKVDADTALITNVAGIFGPPFIGPVAETIQNREIVVTGMALGAINLAIGNLVGVFMFELLA